MTCERVFYERLEECLHKDESVWATGLLARGTLYHKMTDLQIRQIVRDSLQCADEQWDKWKSRAGALDIEEFLVTESVRIEEDEQPLPNFYLNFAEYGRNPPCIRLLTRAIEQTEKVIQDGRLGLLLEEVDLRRLILAHELYHHLEAEDSKIFTNHAYVEMKRFGIRQRMRVRAASEIAAIHFSKLATGVSYCPAIMELLLVYSVDEQRARILADQLITEKWG